MGTLAQQCRCFCVLVNGCTRVASSHVNCVSDYQLALDSEGTCTKGCSLTQSSGAMHIYAMAPFVLLQYRYSFAKP